MVRTEVWVVVPVLERVESKLLGGFINQDGRTDISHLSIHLLTLQVIRIAIVRKRVEIQSLGEALVGQGMILALQKEIHRILSGIRGSGIRPRRCDIGRPTGTFVGIRARHT